MTITHNPLTTTARTDFIRVLIIAVLLGLATALTACNTTEGAGKDIKAVGQSIEDTAHDAKN